MRGSVRLLSAAMAGPPVTVTSQLYTEGLLWLDERQCMGPGRRGVSEVFLGDNIPTVTHMQAPCMKSYWVQHIG